VLIEQMRRARPARFLAHCGIRFVDIKSKHLTCLRRSP
jgi:hypothetical protein